QQQESRHGLRHPTDSDTPRTLTSHRRYQASPALNCPSLFCTGRGTCRRDSGRPQKAGY
ncbi:hypothetical protein DBR06_SOUSAS15810021, partial [Sousa chinensis]